MRVFVTSRSLVGVSETHAVSVFRTEEITFGRGQIRPMWK